MTPHQQTVLEPVARAYCVAKGLVFGGPSGDGVFKATFRAEDPAGSVLAVKVYLPGAVNERANREIDAMIRLSQAGQHSLPSFLDVVAFAHNGSTHLISVEEYLAGGTLGERLRQVGLLTRSHLVALARQMASALSVVAAAGLVHRDIKPDNIMYRADGTAVLVDFGLVRNLGMQSLTQTWLTHGPGTPLFASAEQLNNDKPLIDRRTDQFALGVSLSYAGFGRHPYAHPNDAADEVVSRVAQRERPHPDFVQWTLAENLRPIAKMVEPWPVSRYRTPSDLQAAWAGV